MKVAGLILNLIIFACLQSHSCAEKSEEKWVDMGGPEHVTSLVIFFKKDSLPEQVKGFHDSVLSKPSPYGPDTGMALPDGVAGDYRILMNGFEGVGINFSTEASAEERESLKRRIKESQIVFRVYENVVPAAISDLPEK